MSINKWTLRYIGIPWTFAFLKEGVCQLALFQEVQTMLLTEN